MWAAGSPVPSFRGYRTPPSTEGDAEESGSPSARRCLGQMVRSGSTLGTGEAGGAVVTKPSPGRGSLGLSLRGGGSCSTPPDQRPSPSAPSPPAWEFRGHEGRAPCCGLARWFREGSPGCAQDTMPLPARLSSEREHLGPLLYQTHTHTHMITHAHTHT